MASHRTAGESDLRNGQRDLLGTSFKVLPSPLREPEWGWGAMYIVEKLSWHSDTSPPPSPWTPGEGLALQWERVTGAFVNALELQNLEVPGTFLQLP